jgi:hypothetical protein
MLSFAGKLAGSIKNTLDTIIAAGVKTPLMA